MLCYLVKRLQAEEQQRLRTEIQASRMISSMEKLLQQMVTFIFMKNTKETLGGKKWLP